MASTNSEVNLCDFDKKLAESAKMWVDLDGNRKKIDFQFTPRILTDSNSSNWLEVDAWSIEPIRVHSGSQGRKIAVEWEYIATSNSFTGEAISNVLRNIKRYFFEFKRGHYPTVWFQFGFMVPDETPFRLRDSSISHGPEMVKSGDNYYPLYTKINITLELATNLKATTDQGIPPKIQETPLRQVQPRWY